MTTLRRLIGMRWTMLFGIAVGALSAALTPMKWFDALFPVVSMNSTVEMKSANEVVVWLHGQKNRDCKYVSIDAFSRQGELLRDLYMERVDRPADGQTKPVGKFDFGHWRIWPTANTKMVTIYVHYDCSGRDVFVNVAEVEI